jgi:predicted ArsR family transcriptional regulator
MKYNYEYHRQRILEVLSQHDSLTRTTLRSKAYQRVPKAVSDGWLKELVRKGLIARQYKAPFGGHGRIGLHYRLTAKGKKKASG